MAKTRAGILKSPQLPLLLYRRGDRIGGSLSSNRNDPLFRTGAGDRWFGFGDSCGVESRYRYDLARRDRSAICVADYDADPARILGTIGTEVLCAVAAVLLRYGNDALCTSSGDQSHVSCEGEFVEFEPENLV